jgi:hypothetical protein
MDFFRQYGNITARCIYDVICMIFFKPIKTQEPSKEKKVNFGRTVSVILIPEIKEYKQANISHDVWYTKEELKWMEHNGRQEMKDCYEHLKSKGLKSDIASIKKILYQSETQTNMHEECATPESFKLG